MSLEVLAGVTEIGGFNVIDMNTIREDYPEMFRPDGSMIYHLFDEKIRPFSYIYLRRDVNSISFNIQNGPIKEVGVNGCQVDTLIETAKLLIEKFNEKYPCSQNDDCIASLDQALEYLAVRKANREARGVEGTSAQ